MHAGKRQSFGRRQWHEHGDVTRRVLRRIHERALSIRADTQGIFIDQECDAVAKSSIKGDSGDRGTKNPTAADSHELGALGPRLYRTEPFARKVQPEREGIIRR